MEIISRLIKYDLDTCGQDRSLHNNSTILHDVKWKPCNARAKQLALISYKELTYVNSLLRTVELATYGTGGGVRHPRAAYAADVLKRFSRVIVAIQQEFPSKKGMAQVLLLETHVWSNERSGVKT